MRTAPQDRTDKFGPRLISKPDYRYPRLDLRCNAQALPLTRHVSGGISLHYHRHKVRPGFRRITPSRPIPPPPVDQAGMYVRRPRNIRYNRTGRIGRRYQRFFLLRRPRTPALRPRNNRYPIDHTLVSSSANHDVCTRANSDADHIRTRRSLSEVYRQCAALAICRASDMLCRWQSRFEHRPLGIRQIAWQNQPASRMKLASGIGPHR